PVRVPDVTAAPARQERRRQLGILVVALRVGVAAAGGELVRPALQRAGARPLFCMVDQEVAHPDPAAAVAGRVRSESRSGMSPPGPPAWSCDFRASWDTSRESVPADCFGRTCGRSGGRGRAI